MRDPGVVMGGLRLLVKPTDGPAHARRPCC
jgi:hypothetical protein